MNYKPFKNIQLSRLGMGNMRLPQKDPNDRRSPIDWPEAHKIIDYAYDHGINYFDTAYVYNGGESEKCLGECMKKHPRGSFYLATKFHINSNPDYKAVFEEQLKRLQTDYIDFYLIHCLTNGNVDTYLNSGCIDYFLEQKRLGRIKYLGFSSHADCPALEKFADAAKWDFAQLQLNYYDWNFSSTKKEYEILTSRNIPVMVMEPVRGGRLASLDDESNKMLKAVHPDWSIPAWALRFVMSLDNVQVILSGMSTMDQVIDNVNTFSDSYKFTKEDEEVLFKAAQNFKKKILIPCTGCNYCVPHCPVGINIPDYLTVYNSYKIDGPWALQDLEGVKSNASFKDCIGCKSCLNACPQGIDSSIIFDELKKVTK